MRWNRCLISIALASMLSARPGVASTFGTVVPIGGHASDVALDEGRGVLYISNFTANRIEVMSTADYTIHTSMNVAPQPGAVAISPDGRYLIVAHYGNITPSDPSRNAVTLINLDDNTRQTFSTGDTPLAVTFLANSNQPTGLALVVTTTSFLVFDPISGAMTSSTNFGNVAKVLPTDLDTLPQQVTAATITTNPSRTVAYAMADSGSAQAFYRIDAASGNITGAVITALPRPLARLSVSRDGSWAMAGLYKIDGTFNNLAQFPNAISSTSTGGNVVDPNNNVIWAQIATAAPTTGSTSITDAITGGGSSAAAPQPPTLMQLDPDNLYVLESYSLQENITGRMVLSGDSSVLYAVSDSGVTVFPIGRIKQQNRVQATVSDVVARSTFCNRTVIIQSLTITDPGGGGTADFNLTTNAPGVTISPSSGRVPATVQVRIDPTYYQNQNGTAAVNITLASATAINIPQPIRLLVNNRNPDQRGTFFNVPGTLTDLLSDPVRNRFYIVQQDRDQVLVFDSTTYQQIAALKTSATPTQMAITFDRKYLIIGHDNAQQAWVYDLDTFERQRPIQFPPGHYPRSIAESGKTMLALVRNVATGGPGVIDRIDFNAKIASQLPSLGIYTNSVSPASVLSPAPNGGTVFLASPDGQVMLYDANADTFTISRQDFKALAGAYAASSYNTYVAGSVVLNASLVPMGTLETSSGTPSGFAFIDQSGFRTMQSSASSPGVIQRFASNTSGPSTRTVEAPIVPTGFQKFIRTVAPFYDHSGVVMLTVSGFTVLPWNYDAAVAPPRITSVVNAADGKLAVAPGGLISIYGTQMAPVNMATKEVPLPTALADSCLTVNGVPVPVLFVSSTQINGQLPVNVDGNASMTLRTPGGISDNFNFSILPAAPSIFRSGSAGSETGIATVTRAANGELVTGSNPIHPGDSITIWATGLGRTSPLIDSGMPAPSDPLPSAVITPILTIGGSPITVDYAGLVPGAVGLYQINATVPRSAPQGLDIPLVVNQGGTSTTLSVRVVK